jgi:uncharacterized protein (DUF2249 family)
MKTESTDFSDKIMDVRGIPCLIKHGRIIQRFTDLPVGDYFVLVNDHDPIRLRDQFSVYWPQAFSWDYVARHSDEVHVKIGKIAPTPHVEFGIE